MSNFNDTSCGVPLSLPDIDTSCPDALCCSARFEANPDASGIGIVIAFAGNGAINMSLATFLWYLKQFRRPKNPRFERWVQDLSDFLAQASLFLGITLLVAAFSQYRKITTYHFYVSMMLADLATSGRVVVLLNVLLSNNRIFKVQALLAGIFQLLFIGSLIEVIRRLSAWENEPGKCFAMYHGGLKTIQERNFIRAFVILQLVVWFYWHIICPLQVYAARDALERVPRRVRFWFSFVFYVVLDLALWIWGLYLVAAVMVGNRDRIIGTEWELGFGQVASLVALFTVGYAIFLSYQSYLVSRQSDDDSREPGSMEKLLVV